MNRLTIGCTRWSANGFAIRAGRNCAKFKREQFPQFSAPSKDVLIAATTAAGKTEAAFLPILTVVAERAKPGFSVLYISPLKALINDQFRRLDELCERMEIPVVKWHGDAPQAAKKKAIAKPDGIALITPESIEAMLTRRPGDARRLLGSADFIIVDEVHAFLHGPRGLHVASLLRRIDAMSAAPARRIGLSATIGDLKQAAAWLRPTDPSNVEILEAKSGSPELRLQIRDYVEPPDLDDPDRAEVEAAGNTGHVALDAISDHIFENLRGANNLVFGGSRRTVEACADRLRRRSEKANVPNEFFPHHGSLSKTLREDLEDRLKTSNLPTTAICTSTLELGIDIGSVKSVGQIGAPRSISSLRQRLGRTGRRRRNPVDLADLRARTQHRTQIQCARSTSCTDDPRGSGDPSASCWICRAISAKSGDGLDTNPSDFVGDHRAWRNSASSLVPTVMRPRAFRDVQSRRFRDAASAHGRRKRETDRAGTGWHLDAGGRWRTDRPVARILRGIRGGGGVAADIRRSSAGEPSDIVSRSQGQLGGLCGSPMDC